MGERMTYPGLLKLVTTFASFLAVLLFAVAHGGAAAVSDQQALVDEAKETFENFVNDPNMGWFRDNLKTSEGLVIFPQVLRAGFIFGVEGGSGVAVARDDKLGWSNPAFYTMASGSFGLQIGAQGAEVILMVKTKKGMDSLVTSSFKLGGDVDVALGPVGAGARAKLASIIAFARAKGIYGGIVVDGAVIATRDSWNQEYYGKEVRPADILLLRKVKNKEATALVQAVTKATK
jgi:lipid-binding SYLF domain-containing protein